MYHVSEKTTTVIECTRAHTRTQGVSEVFCLIQSRNIKLKDDAYMYIYIYINPAKRTTACRLFVKVTIVYLYVNILKAYSVP